MPHRTIYAKHSAESLSAVGEETISSSNRGSWDPSAPGDPLATNKSRVKLQRSSMKR